MKTKTMNQIHAVQRNKVRRMAQIGMLSAISAVLMLFEVPLPFAPAFYEIDFSEVPVLVGCFAMGPTAGAFIEFVKILLNLAINGSITAGVGELANFLIGCAFVLPAGWIYRRRHNRRGAIWGMSVGTAAMTVAGCILNAYVLLPAYAKAFDMPLEGLVEMGAKVNGQITDLTSFVLFAAAPFNLLKGAAVSLIVLLIYKKISPILKMNK